MLDPASMPTIVPVHNLGAGGNTPPFWLSPPQGLGWRHAMFNAYFLKDRYHVSMFSNLTAWVDSGGFLFLDVLQRKLAGSHGSRGSSRTLMVWSEDLVEEVLHRQEQFGADVAFTLDYPLPPKAQTETSCCPRIVAERLRATAAAAGIAYQLRNRRSMKILVVLQFNGLETLDKLLDMLRYELRERASIELSEVDGFAVGGLVPHSGKWWLLAKRLQEVRRRIGWDKHLHILGVASPHNIALLYMAGADSMDSKTYIIAAAKRLYYKPPGNKPARIELGRYFLKERPRDHCGCFACSMAEDFEHLRINTRLLALHNLYVTLEAARLARKAHNEGRLTKYVKQLATTNPRLRKALREVREPRPQLLS